MGFKLQGKEVGNIGFGLMGLTWRTTKLSDDQIFPLFKEAIAVGCNAFNASEIYGTPDHNSLTVLSRYYEKYPEDIAKIHLNCKGCVFPPFALDASPDGVNRSIENNVRLIGGKGRIHLFEPARKDRTIEIEATVAAIAEHVQNGNIGGVALSEVSAATIRRAAKVAKIEAVEVELSLWSTEPLENGVVEACAELDIPIFAYSPLGRGILGGKIKSLADIPEGDIRRALPRFQPGVFDTNLQLAAAVEKIADRKGCTPAQVAINWVLALSRRPGMPRIIPIPGASSVERIRENSVEVELTDEDMSELAKIMKEFPPVGDRYDEHGMASLDY